ncbi:MAG: hypothetical protein ACLFWR_06690 [Acidimicrobiales bacterium]
MRRRGARLRRRFADVEVRSGLALTLGLVLAVAMVVVALVATLVAVVVLVT